MTEDTPAPVTNGFEEKARQVVRRWDLSAYYVEGGCGDECGCVSGVCELAVSAISKALEEAVREERREIMNLLGMDENGDGLVTVKEWDGKPVNVGHDLYYNLEGALIDLRRQGADKVCIRTIEHVQEKLANVSNRAESLSYQYGLGQIKGVAASALKGTEDA